MGYMIAEEKTMPTLNITTCLDAESWGKGKKSGLKWNQLIKLGLASLENRDRSAQLHDLQTDNESLRRRVSELGGRLLRLEGHSTQKARS